MMGFILSVSVLVSLEMAPPPEAPATLRARVRLLAAVDELMSQEAAVPTEPLPTQ